MERNIGDQLNKAFEAYRQASIEKDNAKKELQQTTEYYERHTQTLQKQIEDQQQLIKELEAQLRSAPSGEMKCEVQPRKQEDGIALPCNHQLDGTPTCRKMHYLKENMETAVIVPLTLPAHSNVENKDMLEVLEAIQGKFQQIRSLTRRQKDHLKRFYGGKDSFNDQQFSMPIQCTDGTAEQAERPFPAILRSGGDIPRPPTSLASRSASPEDRDLDYSLNKLSVKFPPLADVEYDFLNSAPEKDIGLVMTRNKLLSTVPATVNEEVPVDLAIPFPYPSSPSQTTTPSTSLSQESVCGPQQPLWSPDLSGAVAQAVSVEPKPPQSSSPDKCAFCQAEVPQDRMNSHLYSHCSPKSEAAIDTGNRD
ncbi:TRAF family member-associated NF-kappa-B activator [Aplochiton taeniatus]